MSISNSDSSLEQSNAAAARGDAKRPASHAIRSKKRRSLTPRTRCVFTRLTEQEYATVTEQAGTLPVNTYARYVLLKESRLLEEILALRMIVLNLSGEPHNRVTSVRQQADAVKQQEARRVMEQ